MGLHGKFGHSLAFKICVFARYVDKKEYLIFLRCGFKIDEQRSERRAKRGAGAVSWLNMACMEPWSGNGDEKLIIHNHKSILNH